ncbi:MAG TPA: DUF4235 domain-containing protein [Cytophagaceae bacterium]
MNWKRKALRKRWGGSNRNALLQLYIINGATIISELAVRQGLKKAWRLFKKTPPPQDTASYKTPWKEAIIWTALYSLTAGMAGLIGRRLARIGWNKAMS